MSSKIDKIVRYVERGIEAQIESRGVTVEQERVLIGALEAMLKRRRALASVEAAL